jgi:integrase/recombinase XerD
MRNFRTVKRGIERVRDVLTVKEFKRLLKSIDENTVLGIRDKSMLILLYGTGIRASELCGIKEKDINFEGFQLKVFGKGQRERVVCLNNQVVKYLKKYMKVRGRISKDKLFFRTRLGAGVSRKGLYDRVKKYVRLAGINKVISPHNIRHSFATALIEGGKHTIVTIKKMLGHRSISSTIRYLRENPEDMRRAANMHPVNSFNDILNEYLPNVRMPFQLSRSSFK